MTSALNKSDGRRRAIILVDNRFQIEIIRHVPKPETSPPLWIYVYPITDGEVWEHPCEVFDVDEASIIELEKEMRE
jgi:hypothetical protein